MKYRWKIFLAELNPVRGSEQGKTRPVIVISNEEMNNILPVLNVLPITSKKESRKVYINEVFLPKGIANIDRDSIVLTYQIRTIDKSRLIKEIGTLEDEIIKDRILESLVYQLELL